MDGRFSLNYPDAIRNVQEFAVEIRSYLADCGPQKNREDVLNSLFPVGIGLSSFLPKEELDPVWDVLRPEGCGPFFPDSWASWIDLFRAVGERDGEKMAALAEGMLAVGQNPYLHPLRARYLLAVGMLGHLAGGDREASLRLWSRYGESVVGHQTLPVLFRFLLAHAEGRILRDSDDLFLREDSPLDHWVRESPEPAAGPEGP
jgi:hypothetical protein